MGTSRNRGVPGVNVYFCSVGHKPAAGEELIVAPGEWQIIKIPYSDAQEFTDRWDMHDRRHPDAYVVQEWRTDERSGLIWPCRDGLGCLEMNVHWEAGDYKELRDQFARNPFGPPGEPTTMDTTATDHRAPTTGMQCFTKQHWLQVNRLTPLCLRVAHDSTTPKKLLLVEFKLTVFSRD